MTRGPRAKKAIEVAKRIAAERGDVLEIFPVPGLPADFIIFARDRVIFVLVKRTRRHLPDAAWIALDYAQELNRIQRMPPCLVVSGELWVIAPWGTVQYFRIIPGPVVEVRRDGLPLEVAGKDAGLGRNGTGQ